MFESLRQDPGERALNRAAMIFNVLGVLAGISFTLGLVLRFAGGAAYGVFFFVWTAGFAGLSLLTAHGMDEQRMWAKRLGYVLGFLSLLNIPIGTVIGIAIIIYIQRASRAGLFVRKP